MIPAALNLAVFGLISWLSFGHFAKGRDTAGNTAIRIGSAAATLVLADIALAEPGPRQVAAGLAMALAGASVGVLGAAVRATPRQALGLAFSLHGSRRLVVGGIYGWIRNPFYLGYLLYWAAWIPATGYHAAAIANLLLFGLVYGRAARQEEAFLRAAFGDAFDGYARRTGRFLPVPSATHAARLEQSRGR